MPCPKQSDRLVLLALVTGIMSDLALVCGMVVLIRWIVFGSLH